MLPFRHLRLAIVLIVTTIALVMACGWLGLARSWPRIVGATLVASWAWSGLAITLVGLTEIFLTLRWQEASPAHAAHLRYLAAASTFCPVMALLGAKRPQHRAWQFIVLTLWVVLVMPVGESLLNRPGAELTLHPGRVFFLVLLAAMGVSNRVATNAWLPATLWGAGQAALLAEHLAPAVAPAPASAAWLGLVLLCGALLWPMCRRATDSRAAGSIERLWLDFRDAFGVVWSLRVMERFNAAVEQQGQHQKLAWHGLAPTDELKAANLGADAVSEPAQRPDVPRDLRMLLLRFVSPAWIEARVLPTTEPSP